MPAPEERRTACGGRRERADDIGRRCHRPAALESHSAWRRREIICLTGVRISLQSLFTGRTAPARPTRCVIVSARLSVDASYCFLAECVEVVYVAV